MKQASSTYWRKWAAKHECEELKEGIWLEPALALLRRKTKDESSSCRKEAGSGRRLGAEKTL